MLTNLLLRHIASCDPIPLWYWKYAVGNAYNAGDILSKYIVEKLSGRKTVFSDRKSLFNFTAVGSLISNSKLKYGGVYWGTGMHNAKVKKHLAPCVFTAVRGPLTRRSLLDAGYRCPDIYGDPALLMPSLYPSEPKKRYRLGIICHYVHIGLVQAADDVLFIDIRRTEETLHDLIDEICSCEMIFSSSLHGVILANAYGIPARYFCFEGIPLAGVEHKKFEDYFLSVGMPNQKPLMITKDTFISTESCRDMDKTVDLKIDLGRLRDAFPFA